MELGGLVTGLAEERQATPADDLVSALVSANIDGEQLTPAELASFFILLVVAGNETTRNAISHALVLLTEHPDQREVLLFYQAANRDESVFADPDRFDITRSPNPHVGFGGAGPHFCLGAHLARREISVMLRELLRRVPTIRAAAEPDRLLSSFINGIKHLRCDFG